jgi:hypothetical protein
MERLAPDLGIGKKTPARGGSYWGISKPRYQTLSLFALAACIGGSILSVIVAVGFPGGTIPGYDRWEALAAAIFLVAAIPTLPFFLVRVIGSKSWQWLGGFLFAFVPGIIIILLNLSLSSGRFNIPLIVDWSVLLLMVPSFLILAFAVFGPTYRARQIFLRALILVVVLCACYTYWLVSK